MKYLKLLVFALAAMFAVNSIQAAVVYYHNEGGAATGTAQVYDAYWSTSFYFNYTSYSLTLQYDDATNQADLWYTVSDGTDTYSTHDYWYPGVPGAAYHDFGYSDWWVWSYDDTYFFNPYYGEFFSLYPIPPPPPPQW